MTALFCTGMVASGIQATIYELLSETRASAYPRLKADACSEVGNVHCSALTLLTQELPLTEKKLTCKIGKDALCSDRTSDLFRLQVVHF